MKTIKLGSLLRVAAMLSTFGAVSLAQAGAIVVNFEVNGNKLVATTPGNCAVNNTPGCVRASGQVQINFNLTGETSCALDRVVLGEGGAISGVAASDFNADMSSGLVTPISQSNRHILIRDNNTAVYDIAYTVHGNCGGNPINSDPRVENDGSGHP